MTKLPSWASDLAEQYFGGTMIEFIVSGNVSDRVAADDGNGGRSYVSLRRFLGEKLFPQRDAVVFYDPSSGVTFRDDKTYADFMEVIKVLDTQQGTSYAKSGLPRDSSRALYLVEKYMRYKVAPPGNRRAESVALVVDYADLVFPAGDPGHLSLSQQSTLVTLLRWAKDPVFLDSNLTVVLIAENLAQLNKALVESPYIGRVEIKLPDEAERLQYIEDRFAEHPELAEASQIESPQFSKLTGGLSRVNLDHVTSQARANKFPITADYVSKMKRELIEKECFGMLEFLTSDHGLDTVCGHAPQKAWLRADARLIREGRTDALPMGYLICGPVGTGKSFMAQCFTHDIGIPCVRLKNFRSQWYGATEANWQKILSVLKAAGPVGVVIDEADAAVGDRSSGHEVSNRVFSMLATEMGDTRNRGHILWFLLTSRPDLLPVDIKRQGRAEIHIPLFYPHSAKERRQMREILVKKCGLDLTPEALALDVAMIADGAEASDEDTARDELDDARNSLRDLLESASGNEHLSAVGQAAEAALASLDEAAGAFPSGGAACGHGDAHNHSHEHHTSSEGVTEVEVEVAEDPDADPQGSEDPGFGDPGNDFEDGNDLEPDDPEWVQVYMNKAGLSGAEIESVLIRAKRHAVLAGRDQIGREDLRIEAEAYTPNLSKDEIELQILAAVLECSDKRFLPPMMAGLDRGRVRSRMLLILRAMTSNVDIRTQ